ncbi:MAG TPA: mercury(II) reductase [Dehalococcoidia bacterium]|nr:mercury(II) reductase [Dehalococcoidia bacterium]
MDYDLVIIGGGAAGFAAATHAVQVGARTAMVNAGLPLGGTCVNVGCVPSKHLLALAEGYHRPQHPPFPALGAVRPPLDLALAIAGKGELTAALRRRNYQAVLESFGELVTFYEGWARFRSPYEVEVDGQVLRGERFIVATGSRPAVLPFPGIEGVDYITSREAMELTEVPDSLIVVGAGPTGLELGQLFARLGTRVTVLERLPQVLPRAEPEVSRELQRCLEAEGMEFHCACEIRRVWQEGETRGVLAEVMGEERVFRARHLLLATGIAPNSEGLGLEAAGVERDRRGFIVVDEAMRTSAPHIYAAGDVVGRMPLETVAAREGYVAARNALEGAGERMDYERVPWAVFTDPQVAAVGITEEEEMGRLGSCLCRTVPMSQVPKAMAVGDTRGLVKLVVHPQDRRILGVHIVASQAAEMVHEGVLAVRLGLTVDDLVETVHVFPTFSEALKLAALAFQRDVSVMACCIR